MYKIIEWAPNHFITENLKAWPFSQHKKGFELYVKDELYVVPVKRTK